MEETLIWYPTKMFGGEKKQLCIYRAYPRPPHPKPTWRISAVMKTFKGVLITEEGCIQENNYLACNSLEEAEYFREESCWKAKNMQTRKGVAICCRV